MKKHLVITEDTTVCNITSHELDGQPEYNMPDSYYNFWPIERDKEKQYRAFIIEISKHMTTLEILKTIEFENGVLSIHGVKILRQDEIHIVETGSA